MKRGLGSVYRPKYRDRKTGEQVESPNWWVQYYVRGVPKREPVHSTKESDGWKLLKRRHGEIAAGKPVGPEIEKTTFDDMAAMIVNDYKANGRKSLNRAEDAVNHLRGFFGMERAANITGDRVTAYITSRQAEGSANSTINNELAALSRMFVLGMRAGRVASKPYICKLALSNVRKGFFEADQIKAVMRHLPEDLRALVFSAFVTGWRVDSELLNRQRHHVDLKHGWLRLDPGETKNGEGRNFPLVPMLREVLEQQIAQTEALQKATGRIIPWLFHRDGAPIKSFRRSWRTACKAAGVPGRIRHDFRRTAVRNLERAGVPRSAAMKMVGHKTQAIYSRYAIADDGMLKDAGQKLEQLYAIDNKQSTNKAEAISGA